MHSWTAGQVSCRAGAKPGRSIVSPSKLRWPIAASRNRIAYFRWSAYGRDIFVNTWPATCSCHTQSTHSINQLALGLLKRIRPLGHLHIRVMRDDAGCRIVAMQRIRRRFHDERRRRFLAQIERDLMRGRRHGAGNSAAKTHEHRPVHVPADHALDIRITLDQRRELIGGGGASRISSICPIPQTNGG